MTKSLSVLLFLVLIAGQRTLMANPSERDPVFPYSYRAWSTAEGAPHSYINGIAMSPDGYVWVETPYGFARFNGISFTEVPLPDLHNEIYRNLTADHAGRIWMHAPGTGVYVRQPTGQIERVSFIPSDRRLHFVALSEELFAWNCCTVMRIDYEASRVDTLLHLPDGNFGSTIGRLIPLPDGEWLSLRLRGLQRLGTQGASTLLIDTRNPGHISRDLVRLENGDILLASTKGIYRYANGALLRIPLRGIQPETEFNHIHIGVDGHLYVATSSGLYRFRGQDLTAMAERLTYQDGVSVLVMSNGQIWYGTKFNGLLLLTPRVFRSYSSPSLSLSIEGMLLDREGSLWISSTCSGIYRLSSGRVLDRFLSTHGRFNPCRWGLFQDSRGTIWSGSWGDGFSRFDGRTFREHPGKTRGVTMSFVEMPDGRLFAGSSFESILEIDPATGAERRQIFPQQPDSLGVVRGLFIDRSGTLWVGTTHRIWRLLPDGTVEDVPVLGRPEGARTFFEAADGSLWAGLIHRGVARLNPPGIQTFGSSEGLGNNTVSFLYDFRSSLLIGTNSGIVQVPYAGLAAFMDGRAERPNRRIMGSAEGMPVAETNGGFSSSILTRPDSSLLIATPAGVLVMYPHLLPNPPPYAQVMIERAVVDTLVLTTTRETNILPLGARRIQIEYLALTFSPSGEDYYETLLEGLDTQWIPAGSQTVITYSNLGPGRYTFRVRAFTKQGDVLESMVPLTFVVPPYFHETPPFWILVLVLALVGIFSIDRLQRRRLSARQHELEMLVALRTDELATRNAQLASAVEAKDRMLGVASHDIRSPLASIVSMTELLEASDLDPESREYIQDIRAVADRTLRLVQDVLSIARMKEIGLSGLKRVPLSFDVLVAEVVKEHAFEALQKRQHLRWSPDLMEGGPFLLEGDSGLLRQAITNLIGNAIKYSPIEGEIVVSLSRRDETLHLSITDQGPGVAPDKLELIFEPFTKGNAVPTGGEHSTGLGLAIVREIVAAHEGRVWCETVSPHGAKFVIELPTSA